MRNIAKSVTLTSSACFTMSAASFKLCFTSTAQQGLAKVWKLLIMTVNQQEIQKIVFTRKGKAFSVNGKVDYSANVSMPWH